MLWGDVTVRRGVAYVPYVRLMSREEARRARLWRGAGWTLIGALGVGASLAALWEARSIIFGALMFAGSLRYLLRHRVGCAGLHCPGCHG